jgi:hypothetical protein
LESTCSYKPSTALQSFSHKQKSSDQSPTMAKASSSSSVEAMKGNDVEGPQSSTAGANMPDYWDLPNNQGHMETHPIVYYGCRRNGGIHLSWLHYITLYVIIFFLSVVITIWTAIAMHRADTILSFQSSNQPHCNAETLQPAPNSINFSPYIVVGGVKDNEELAKTVTTVTTTMITFSPAIALTNISSSQAASLHPSLDVTPARSKVSDSSPSAAPALKPDVDSVGSAQPTKSSAPLSGNSTELQSDATDTATVTTTAITSPTKPPVVPSTLYFKPPESATGSIWQPLGGGL